MPCGHTEDYCEVAIDVDGCSQEEDMKELQQGGWSELCAYVCATVYVCVCVCCNVWGGMAFVIYMVRSYSAFQVSCPNQILQPVICNISISNYMCALRVMCELCVQ